MLAAYPSDWIYLGNFYTRYWMARPCFGRIRGQRLGVMTYHYMLPDWMRLYGKKLGAVFRDEVDADCIVHERYGQPVAGYYRMRVRSANLWKPYKWAGLSYYATNRQVLERFVAAELKGMEWEIT